MPPSDGRFASVLGVIPNRVQPFSTVNPSKPALCVVISAGTMGGKKILGRKRHLLVDTQGLLMSVKVLEASLGDREGGKEVLLPLAGKLPRLQVIWVDSGYAGEPFKQWVKEHLGMRLEIVNHHRRLSRDFEGTYASSEAFIYLAMTRLMVARLARAGP